MLQAHKSSVEIDNFEHEINQITKVDSDYAAALEKRLTDISLVLSVSDITNSCQNISPSVVEQGAQQLDGLWEGLIPPPTLFRHHIKRDNQRFLIHTSINLQIPHQDKIDDIITTDVSNEGLSLSLPGKIELKIGTRVSVDFIRWQSQTKKTNLLKLPYIVRNNKFCSGESHLGLERETFACEPSLNRFFTTTIERNKEQLVENNTDVFLSQETNIFSSLLVQHLTAIPFYLAMDVNKQRYLQAIATSVQNHANSPDLWSALQHHVLAMSQRLNNLVDTHNSLSFGIYCYQENSGEWKIQTDMLLDSTSQKSLFINQAIRNEHYHFYNCSLTPIKSTLIEQEEDLNRTFLEWRSHSPHKVKQIRETLHSLYAVGELIDITDIIKSAYS